MRKWLDAAKGYVVTNNHVVDNASVIKVQLSDGRKIDAVRGKGKDPRSGYRADSNSEPKNLTAIAADSTRCARGGLYRRYW